MKKLVFSLVVFAAMCMASCGSKTASTEATTDSTLVDSVQVADTVACDSIIDIADSIQ